MKTFKRLWTLCWLASTAAMAGENAPVMLVNPLMGTDSTGDFSHGNQYPAIALPFPMNTWAPYTQPEADSFFYLDTNLIDELAEISSEGGAIFLRLSAARQQPGRSQLARSSRQCRSSAFSTAPRLPATQDFSANSDAA